MALIIPSPDSNLREEVTHEELTQLVARGFIHRCWSCPNHLLYRGDVFHPNGNTPWNTVVSYLNEYIRNKKEVKLKAYQCCDPSVDQTQRTRIIAESAKQAAEEYAILAQEMYEGQGTITIPVWVYDENGYETQWEVTRTFRPVFEAELE